MGAVLSIEFKGQSISLRRPLPSDAVYIASYWFGPQSEHLKSGLELARLGDYESMLANLQKGFSETSESGPWTTLVGTIDGEPAGTILLNGFKQDEEALVHVHIWETKYRRIGLASRLAYEAFSYFLQAFRLKRLVMQVQTDNVPVISLLKSLGVESEGAFFGKAAALCQDGAYERFVVTSESLKSGLNSLLNRLK